MFAMIPSQFGPDYPLINPINVSGNLGRAGAWFEEWMHMEYQRLQTIESEPVIEPTGVTLRTIKEILAETGNLDLLIPASAPAEPAPVKAEQAVIPPRVRPAALSMPSPSSDSTAEQTFTPTAQVRFDAIAAPARDAEHGRGLIARLFGRR